MAHSPLHCESPARRGSTALPVFIVGAGAIVRSAHLPGYASAGIPVAGLFDLDAARASEAAACCGARHFDELDAMLHACAEAYGVLDLAVPPQALGEILARVPHGMRVLMQKPFGRDLAEATRLVESVRARHLVAAVNFQLRHAPCVRAVRSLVRDGAIGDALDAEIRVVCRMPWETWPFLEGLPRMEVLMHSIHYLDLCRALFGEPERVWCATARHPAAPRLADTRSTTVLSFGESRRAVVSTYHHHAAPAAHDASQLRVEGTRGTIVAQLGVNLDYPRGRPDFVEISRDGGAWERVAVEGNWFPDAFGASMLALQRFARGESTHLESSAEDAWRTMALVETCYKSALGGERLPEPPSGP